MDDVDRSAFLEVLAHALARFDAQVWAYCLMGNHYHLVLQTRQANLSRLMCQINGVYTQAFNRRHGIVGHLFQGPLQSHPGRRRPPPAGCLSLRGPESRARAQMVKHPQAYAWSSYRAHTGQAARPPWLESKPLYAQLAPGMSQARAAHKYAEFVAQGAGLNLRPRGVGPAHDIDLPE